MSPRDAAIRLMDLLASLTGLILATPLLLFTCLMIAFFDGLPVFHTHERYGADHKRFKIIKFRTLKKDYPLVTRHYAEGKGLMQELTRFGGILRRTHLNELPQVVNVIKGEMSLVGPRPVICSNTPGDTFGEEVMEARMRAGLDGLPPGVTGFTQLEGSDLPLERLMKLDSKYLKERSVSLNLKLIVKTVSYLAQNLLSCLKP